MMIRNLREARETFEASGFYDWQWFEGFDQDDLIEFIYRHSDHDSTLEDLIKSFLVVKGEDPSDYFSDK